MSKELSELILLALNPWDMTVTDSNAIVAELRRLAAIDSAATGEVGEIAARCAAGLAGDNILQAVQDIKALLAIVQRQAGEMAEARASLNGRCVDLQRCSEELTHARAEVERLKERAAKDDAGVTIHACPPKGSGIMPCCGRTPFEVMGDRMSTKPEVVNCDRVRLLTEKTESGLTILRLHAEATEQREMAAASELSAREHKGLADLAMQVVATRTQELMVAEERARALANGIAAYRAGGYTAAQVWENEEGKAVPR